MKKRFFIGVIFLVLLVLLTSNVQATPPTISDSNDLIYVRLDSPDDLTRFSSTNLPMYAWLETGLLAGASRDGQQALDEAGLTFEVIDPGPLSGTYYLAETRPGRKAPDFNLYGQVLRELDNGVLLRMDSSMADTLAQAGAELQLITLTPKPIPSGQSEVVYPEVIDPDPLIQLMMDQVIQEDVSQYDRELAGELPVWVDGDWYTIPTRYTYSGTPIQKTTSYVGQKMTALGLDVEYHNWGGATYPNVIGEIPGLINLDDIYIIGGHIDDVQGTPGADDNASGSVAAMIAADILSQYQWGCTLRFAVWTGEEQGLNGSYAYAQRSYQQGENILGYLNLDMIAWNTIGSSPNIDLIYHPSMPPTQQLAQLFDDVVDAYDINLIPELRTSLSGGSDHSSFWNFGYTSILAIEDQGDFNPYYHGPGDTPAHTDLAYFTSFVKASIGTFAHMTECLIPSGIGNLDGHVTDSSGGAPIEGVTVTADDGQGHSFSEITDETGYYTHTLLAGTYDVSASIYGYLPATVSGVEVITNTITTQDFELTALHEPITGLSATSSTPDLLGETTTLTATVTGGTNIIYTWNFGDGTIGGGAVVTHTFPAVGDYEVTVTAENNNNSATASTIVSITDVPVTGLIASNDSPTPLGGITVFTATITSGTNVTYTWYFGDGSTATGQVVTHVYTDAGSYTAVVAASNSLSSMEAETVAVIGSLRFYLPLIKR